MLAQQMNRVGPSARAAAAVRPFRAATVVVRAERLRLGNVGPAKGSRHKETRKGRGYAAGQGGTCGYGNRGQKARSGPGPRPGFEGGQTSLYRRLPKLRGIAGGMSAGLPDFVVLNLNDLDKHFEAGEEVTLAKVADKVLSLSGRDRRLPLKVLGTGKLSKALTIKAGAFSETAKAAIEAAGGTAEKVTTKKKWTRGAHKRAVAAAGGEEAYKKQKLAKTVARLQAKGLVSKSRLAKADKPKKDFAAKGKAAAKGKK